VSFDLHGQAAHVDGVHVLGQPFLGLRNQGVLIPFKHPSLDVVAFDNQREVVGNEDEAAQRGEKEC
jgi:hypothetical protein